MESGFWECVVMKVFKSLWCSRRRRAGRFNVHTANNKNSQRRHSLLPGGGAAGAADSHLTGVIRHCGSEVLIDSQNSDLGGYCRSPVERRGSPTGSVASTQSQSQLTPSRQLSDGERLKKVILELVDTEKTYVKHLNNLLENYLEPLKSASFLSSAEVNALFGNIREIVAFQRLFLQALQEALDMEPGFPSFDSPYEFKNVLFSIGSAFLYYASQFKLYSSFCASHSKAQKVLHPSEGNQALQEFLASRNPRQQHSATLESYLIKPIQRILKYPLLLQQLKALTTPGSDEHRHLLEALKVMEKVAEHINEMQRIHEEYGAIFDHLFRQHQKSCKQSSPLVHSHTQPVDLSPGDLLYYGGVEWLNISDFLGKIKKGLELHAMCFVFKTAVVFLCKERLRQKKKLMVTSGAAPGKNSASEVEIIRYQVLIPVTEVQVRASSMKDMDSHFLWELIHLKSQLQRRSEKVYHLSNSTAEFRNAFLKTIRQIIRESVRNMNIPANKPSSSSSSSASGLGTKGSTNTLQPVRSGGKKKTNTSHQSATLQRHSAGNIDYDNLETYDNVPDSQHDYHHQQHQPHHTNNNLRTRSKTVSDAMDELSDSTTKSDGGKEEAGTRSEGEDEVMETKKKATLGRTPNHLSLSTTSTLSTGSTGSMAKLIQASNQPSQYQPTRTLGSPVWKPRDVFASGGGGGGGGGQSQTLPRPGKSGGGREDHFLVYEEYGGNIYTSSNDSDSWTGQDDDDDEDDNDYSNIGNKHKTKRRSWGVPAPAPPPPSIPPPRSTTHHLLHLPDTPPRPPPPPRSGPHVTVIHTKPSPNSTSSTPHPPPSWPSYPSPLYLNGHPTPPTPPQIHTPRQRTYTHTDTHRNAHKNHNIHRPHSQMHTTDTARIHTHRPHTHTGTHRRAHTHIHAQKSHTHHIPRIHTHTHTRTRGREEEEDQGGGGVEIGRLWPGFPNSQGGFVGRGEGGRVMGRGEQRGGGQGMTIDSLLQQLRALS